MKKILLSLILILAFAPSIFAQDIDRFISDLSKIDGVEHQLIDSKMLDEQLKTAMESDPSGKLKSQLPSFMQKIDVIEAVVLEDSPEDIKNEFISKLSNLNLGEDFETLLKVKEENTIVHIVKKKDNAKETSDVYVLVVDDADIVVVRMSGDFTNQDIKDIVEEQQKNLK